MRLFVWLSAFFLSAHAAALTVGATTEDMAALVRAVGGGDVESFAIAKGTQDPHQIEAKPSYMVKLRHADLIVAQGLDLETAWLKPLIEGARNPKIALGTKTVLELGESLDPLDVQKGEVSRAEGDVHPLGNPHFQLDPVRLSQAATLIARRMGELDPPRAADYLKRAEDFKTRMESKTKEWSARMKKTGFREFVAYHKTFVYFAARFGLKNEVFLEPKPGIPPTASHLMDVIHQMRARKLKVVLIENFFDDSVKSRLRDEIKDMRVIKVPVYVGGEPGIKTNEDLIENMVRIFETAAAR